MTITVQVQRSRRSSANSSEQDRLIETHDPRPGALGRAARTSSRHLASLRDDRTFWGQA